MKLNPEPKLEADALDEKQLTRRALIIGALGGCIAGPVLGVRSIIKDTEIEPSDLSLEESEVLRKTLLELQKLLFTEEAFAEIEKIPLMFGRRAGGKEDFFGAYVNEFWREDISLNVDHEDVRQIYIPLVCIHESLHALEKDFLIDLEAFKTAFLDANNHEESKSFYERIDRYSKGNRYWGEVFAYTGLFIIMYPEQDFPDDLKKFYAPVFKDFLLQGVDKRRAALKQLFLEFRERLKDLPDSSRLHPNNWK